MCRWADRLAHVGMGATSSCTSARALRSVSNTQANMYKYNQSARPASWKNGLSNDKATSKRRLDKWPCPICQPAVNGYPASSLALPLHPSPFPFTPLKPMD